MAQNGHQRAEVSAGQVLSHPLTVLGKIFHNCLALFCSVCDHAWGPGDDKGMDQTPFLPLGSQIRGRQAGMLLGLTAGNLQLPLKPRAGDGHMRPWTEQSS